VLDRRRHSLSHDKEKNSQCKYIAFGEVKGFTSSVELFRSNVASSSSGQVRARRLSSTLFCEAKVNDFHVKILIKYDIVQLDISVYKAPLVEILNTGQNLQKIGSCYLLC
jgi:hypothetical protein